MKKRNKIDRLTSEIFVNAVLNGIGKVIKAQEHLNKINVFPVPDGDTGTNLAMTLKEGASVIKESRGLKLCEAVRRFSEALILGAKGNSGVILSQFFLEFAEYIRGKEFITAKEFAEALNYATEKTYEALENPVEGTILTVMRDSSRAALKVSKKEKDLIKVILVIYREAQKSLERTPTLLPKLKKSGVVDSGAKGFVLFLEGILEYVREGRVDLPEEIKPVEVKSEYIEQEELEHRYCTEAVVRGEGLESNKLKMLLATLGGSLIVMGAGKLFHIHIHTNWPQKVFELLKEKGEILRKKVDDMLEMNIKRSKGELGIVVDSTADIPLDLAHELDIKVVPLQIIIDGKSYLDGIDVRREEVIEKLVEGKSSITTSQPSPHDFKEAIEESLSKNKKVLIITISSALSGTYKSALLASEEYKDKVFVLDSKLGSFGTGLLAIRAREKQAAGYTIEEIIEHLNQGIDKSYFLLTPGSLTYLARSGRVSETQSKIANFLKLRPIFSFKKDGSLYKKTAGFGTHGTLKKMFKLLIRELNPSMTYDFGIPHVSSSEIAEKIKDFVERNFRARKVLVGEVTPVLSIHTGPGSFGVVAIPVF